MKNSVNISSIIFALACYNNASGMLVKYIKPQQPYIMHQRRTFCTMMSMSQHQVSRNSAISIFINNKPIAPIQNPNEYILKQHRAAREVPQLSEETYQELQKLFDRNNAAIAALKSALLSMEKQNRDTHDCTFYGKELNIGELSKSEERIQKELKILNGLNTNTENE